MTTTFYLRDDNINDDGLSASPISPAWSAQNTPTKLLYQPNKVMSATKGAGPAISLAWAASGNTKTYVGRFVSDLLSAQTFGAGTWHLNFAAKEGTVGADAQLGATLYVYRPTTQTIVGYIFDSVTPWATEWATTEVNNGRDGTNTGSNVTCQKYDVLVLELWVTAPPGGAGVASTPTPAGADIGTKSTMTVCVQAGDWTPASQQALFSKWGASNTDRSWQLLLNTNGSLTFQYQSTTPATTHSYTTSTFAAAFPTSYKVWFKVNLTSSATSFVNIQYALNAGSQIVEPTTGWTSLTTTRFTPGVMLANTTVDIEVGSTEDGSKPFDGVIFQARLRNEGFNRCFYDRDLGPGTWVSEEPPYETWTDTRTGHDLTLAYDGATDPVNNTTIALTSAAFKVICPQTLTYAGRDIGPDPTKIGLSNYGCAGTLSIEWGDEFSTSTMPMNCPAWDISDLTSLLVEYSVRGQDRRVPGVTGALAYRRRYDVTEHALPMWITGDVDRFGEMNEDARAGLEANIALLRATILNPDVPASMNSDGTRLATLVTKGGVTMTARIHVLGMRISEVMQADDRSYLSAVLQISIPAGRFV